MIFPAKCNTYFKPKFLRPNTKMTNFPGASRRPLAILHPSFKSVLSIPHPGSEKRLISHPANPLPEPLQNQPRSQGLFPWLGLGRPPSQGKGPGNEVATKCARYNLEFFFLQISDGHQVSCVPFAECYRDHCQVGTLRMSSITFHTTKTTSILIHSSMG